MKTSKIRKIYAHHEIKASADTLAASAALDELIKKRPKEDCDTLDSLSGDLAAYAEQDGFVAGFKLAMQLMAECYAATEVDS